MPRPAPRLTEAQQTLATDYLALALSEARWLDRTRHNADLVRDAAVDGLIRAAQTFDPGRDRQFAGYARVLIRWQVATAIGHATHRRRQPAAAPISLDAYDFDPACPASEDEARATLAVEAVEHMLRVLPARHARVCRLHYLHGKTMAEVAADLGCSPAWVAYLHAQAVAWFRDAAGAPRPTGPRRRLRHAGPSPRAHP